MLKVWNLDLEQNQKGLKPSFRVGIVEPSTSGVEMLNIFVWPFEQKHSWAVGLANKAGLDVL